MPSVVIPPNFSLVTVQYTNHAGHACVNNLGFETPDPLTQSDVNAMGSALGTVYRAYLSDGSTIIGYRVLEGTDGEPNEWFTGSGGGDGERSGSLLTPQVQTMLKKNTGLSGRKNRGRLFLPDVHESEVDDDGTITSSSLIDKMNDIGGIVLNGNGAAFGAGQLMHPDEVPTPLTSVTAALMVSTQRRRFDRV